MGNDHLNAKDMTVGIGEPGDSSSPTLSIMSIAIPWRTCSSSIVYACSQSISYFCLSFSSRYKQIIQQQHNISITWKPAQAFHHVLYVYFSMSYVSILACLMCLC